MSVVSVMNAAKRSGKQTEKRKKHDLYITPKEATLAIAHHFHIPDAQSILDVGANDGRWGLAFASYCQDATLSGVELRNTLKPQGFDHWSVIDYTDKVERASMPQQRFDLIVGNPPFNRGESMVRAAYNQLTNGGTMIFLLPPEFSHSISRCNGLLAEITPNTVVDLAERMDFTGAGRPHQNMSLYIWKKNVTSNGRWAGFPWSWKQAYQTYKESK